MTRSAFQRVHVPSVIENANKLLKELPVQIPVPEPRQTRIVDFSEIRDSLINDGVDAYLAEKASAEILRICELARFYRDGYWCDVREHKARTFLIIPILLALG